MPAPNLEFHPTAYCPRCERNVAAVQSWKDPRKPYGKYGRRNQYIYCCPSCAKEVVPYYYCAANAIDLNDVGEQIGTKKKPLAARTRQRVQLGLQKFANWQPEFEGVPPFIFNIDHTSNPARYALPSDPMPVQTTNHNMAFVQPPMMVNLSHSGDEGRAIPATNPTPTMTGTREHSVVLPPQFVGVLRSNVPSRSLTDPVSTMVAAGSQHALVSTPTFIAMLRGMNAAKSLTDPIDTVAARGLHHAFISTYNGNGSNVALSEGVPTVTGADRLSLVVPPWIMGYYGARDAIQGLETAVPTQATERRHALLTPGRIPEVDECYFRMFRVPEIKRSMAFDDDYIVKGNQDQQIDQLGNAITPPPMTLIFERCLEVYGRMGA